MSVLWRAELAASERPPSDPRWCAPPWNSQLRPTGALTFSHFSSAACSSVMRYRRAFVAEWAGVHVFGRRGVRPSGGQTTY